MRELFEEKSRGRRITNKLMRAMCTYKKSLFLGVLVAALSGCVALPPKDPAPKLTELRTADFASINGEAISWPNAHWWNDFNDAQLNVLIEQGLAHSPTLALAQARIERAMAAASMVTASQGGHVALDGQISHQLYSNNFIYPPPLGGSTATSANLDLGLRYEFDFWGRQRSAIKAVLGEQAAIQAEAIAAKNALSVAITKAYFQWQMWAARIELLQKIEEQRRVLIALEEQRAKAGLVAIESMQGMRADVSAARQAVVQLETQREQSRSQLQVLVGDKALSLPLQVETLPAVTNGVPADLTLNLLARRPDVKAMRDRVQASLDSIDEARAAFYPNFNLSAFLGLNSLHITKLLRADSLEYGVTPAFHLPIFDANRLRAGLNTRRADLAIAIAQYDQTIQTAIMEVNETSLRLQGLSLEQTPLDAQEQAVQRELKSALLRVQAGLNNQRDVIYSQLNLLSLKDRQLVRHAQALFAQIDLIKALGGGYRSE